VIGEGERRHAQFLGSRHEAGNFSQPVEKGIFGMYVKVDERHERSMREDETVMAELR
jgi:hypothetical protein